MENLHTRIANIEHWLREKPHAGQVEKSEMISRLRELNEELNKAQNAKIKNGLELLSRGESPIKRK